MHKKKGGSPASDAVVKLVSPAAFDRLSNAFTNSVAAGGSASCRKKAIAKVDLNETSTARVMVYNKTGGKKAAATKKAPGKPKAKRPAAKKGGDASAVVNPSGPVGKLAVDAMPPPALPSNSGSSLNMSSIDAVTQDLISMNIETAPMMTKTTVFPESSFYRGPFALGGAKKAAGKKKPSKK